MKHYIEITLIPQAEIPLHFIWSKLYTQLHLALVEVKDADEQVSVGVSFPDYTLSTKGNKALGVVGTKLRLFAPTEADLQHLNIAKWLERLADYVHISSIKHVPAQVSSHLRVSRWRESASPEALIRRTMKRKGVTEAQAQAHFKGYQRDFGTSPPYIQLPSLSGHEKVFRLFISQQATGPHEGRFTTYGLSMGGTVPHW